MAKPDQRADKVRRGAKGYRKASGLFLFILAGAIFASAQTQVTINGATAGAATLYLNSGAVLNVGGSLNVVSSGGGTNNYIQNNGTVQLSSTGTAGQGNISNNVTGLKAYTTGQSTGTVVLAASNEVQTISGSGTAELMNLSTSNTSSPTLNLQQSVTVDGALTIGGATAEINSTTLTLNGTLAATGTFTGSGASNLTINGSGNLGSALSFASGGQSLQNLTLNRSNATGQLVNLGSALSVSGTLTLTNGILNLQGNNLSLGATGTLAGTPFSTTNMIQADGGGQFIRGIAVIGSSTAINFPVGDGTPNYTPVNLTFTSNTASGSVGVNVTNGAEGNNNNPGPPYVNLTRYWTFSNTTLGNYSYTGTFTYPTADLSNSGLQSSLKLSQWTGSNWTQFAGSSASSDILTETTTLTQATAPLTGDFTGRTQCTTPTVYNVTGGTHCDSSLVGLSGSDASVNYQLVLNGTGTGSPVAGTGSAFNFGYQNTAGAYTVVATSFYGGCTSNMNGSSVVNAVPTAYDVTGGACVPADMGLSNTDAGINYQLYRNNTIAVGSPVAGTGHALDFGNQNTAGTYSVVATNATTGCTANMTGVSTVNICLSTWAGATSSSWTDQTNWSPEAVPNNCSANVNIPSGTSYQPVISGSDVSVGSVTMASGATLTLSGNNLNVCGNWTGGSSSSAAIAGSGTVYINSATGAQTISGNTQFNVLQVNNGSGVTLTSGGTIAISTGLQLQSGNLNISAGTLHLLSTAANNNSYIDDFTGSGTLTGSTVTADRYVPVTGLNQHFISSPVSTPSFSQLSASGPDGSYVEPFNCDEWQSAYNSPYGSVFQYNDGHMASGSCMLGNWEIRSQGNLDNGRGYSTYLTGNTTLSLSGAANTGNLSVGNLNNSGYPTVNTTEGDPIESGWNLVGNPYPSAITLTASRIPQGFQNQVLIWVTEGKFEGSWQYAVIDSSPPGALTVAPFQAFMVRIIPGSTGIHSYPFYQSERVRTTNAAFYRAQQDNMLELDLDYNGIMDATTVTFKPGATNTFDDAYDANKTDGAKGRPTLYTTMNDNHWYGLNCVPPLTQATTIPVGLHAEATGTMTITPQGIGSFDPTTYIYLEDKQANTMQDLRSGAYTFSTNINDDQGRFVLHFTPPAEIMTSDASCSSPGIISISQPGSASWNYTVTDNNNTPIASGTLNNNNPVTINANAGIYTLTLTDNNGYTVVKNIQVAGSQSVMASFTTSVTTAQTSQNISFAGTTESGDTYNWNFGDGATGTGQTIIHQYTEPGAYTTELTETNASGCSSTTTRVMTITSGISTGITNLNNHDKINIWSNENQVYVDFSKQTSVDADIEIFNVLGQVLSSEKFGKAGIYTKQIDNLEAAYLIIRVKNDEEVTTKKVFIANVK